VSLPLVLKAGNLGESCCTQAACLYSLHTHNVQCWRQAVVSFPGSYYKEGLGMRPDKLLTGNLSVILATHSHNAQCWRQAANRHLLWVPPAVVSGLLQQPSCCYHGNYYGGRWGRVLLCLWQQDGAGMLEECVLRGEGLDVL